MKPDTWRIEVWSDLYTSLKRKLIKWQIDRNNFFLFLKSYTFFLMRILFFRISSIVFTMTTYINCIILYKYYVDSFNVKNSTNLIYFPWIINYELAEVSKQIIIRLVFRLMFIRKDITINYFELQRYVLNGNGIENKKNLHKSMRIISVLQPETCYCHLAGKPT